MIVAFAGILMLTHDQSSSAQGTFQNLRFELPILPLNPDPNFQVPIADALPGWTGYIGGSEVDRVWYNTVALGSAAISLHGPGAHPAYVLHGSYSVTLQSSYPGFDVTAAIGQVGTVPDTAQSLRFYGHGFVYGFEQGVLTLMIDGQPLPLSILGGSSDRYYIYGADITSFAGQTVEMRFQGGGTLDAIHFSASPIPEPVVIWLVALGTAVLGLSRKWASHHRRKRTR